MSEHIVDIADWTETPPRIISEGVPAAARAAVETLRRPLLVNPLRKALAPPEPVFGGSPEFDPRFPFQSGLKRAAVLTDPGLWARSLFEAFGQIISAGGAAAAELGPEKAKLLTKALAENALFLPWGALRTPKLPPPAPPLFSASGLRGDALPRGPLLTGAAPGSPSVAGAGRELVSTRRVLRPEPVPGPPGQLALPPAVDVPPPQPALPGRVVGDVKALPDYRLGERPPVPKALPPGTYEAPGEIMPTPAKRPYQEPPPVIAAAPLPKTTEILDAQGRPITEPMPAPTLTEREGLRRRERTPFGAPRATLPRAEELPPVPEGPLTSAAQAASARPRPRLPEPPPEGLPAVPRPPEPSLSPPGAILPPVPEVAGELPSKGKQASVRTSRAGPDAASVDTRDPESLGRYIWAEGGLAQSDIEGVPLHLRNRKGRGLDEIIDNIATATGRNHKDVERDVHHTLSRYGMEKEARRRQPSLETQEADYWRGQMAESEVVPPDLGLSQAEWAAMSAEERANTAAAFRFFDDQGGKGGPAASSFSGMLPPIPLPGPEEGDPESTAMVKTAAQALGLSLPVVSMLFSRWRSGPRRPKQQGLGFEGPGSQRGLFDQPLPEVPPTAGLAGRPAPTPPDHRAVGRMLAELPRGGRVQIGDEVWIKDKAPTVFDARGFPEVWRNEVTGEVVEGSRIMERAHAARYDVSPVETTLRFEKTPLGDQAIIPGTPPREMPPTPLKAAGPQKDITETPLFGQERVARETASDAAQGSLVLPVARGSLPPAPEMPPASPPSPIRWQQTRPRAGSLDAYRSADGRFVVEQRTPDEWVAVDRQARAQETFPTFQEARQWVSRMTGGERGAWTPFRNLGRQDEPLPPPVGGRPPEVLPQYRTERIAAEPEGQFQPRAPVVREPAAPTGDVGGGGRGPLDVGGEPPPAPPEAVSVAGAGGVSPVGAVVRSVEYLVLPKISVWERMGELGKAVSRTVQNKFSAEQRWVGEVAEPLIREMKRLTAAEKENLRLVMEGGAAPMNARVARAKQAADVVFHPTDGVVARGARDRSMVIMGPDEQIRPFQGLEDFFPHEFAPDIKREIIANTPRRARYIEHLVNTHQAADAESAAVILDSRFGAKYTTYGDRVYLLDPDRYVGGLERTRDVNLPDYIKDPVAAFTIRLNKIARRFAELDHYGEMDAKIGSPGGYIDPMTGQAVPAHGLIGEIQRTQGYERAQTAHALFMESLGHRPDVSRAIQEAANKVTTLEAITKLPLAAIANASQSVQVALRTNLQTTARGLVASATRAGRDAARDLGVLSDMSLRETYRDAGVAAGGRGVLQRTSDIAMGPFNVIEKWDRIVGAQAGRVWGDVIEGRLQHGFERRARDVAGLDFSDPQGWMHRELDRLNFSREEIADIVTRRRLTAEERDRIAWAITDQTQFLGRAYRRSQFFDTPEGQIVGQFKSFAINAGRLLKQMVYDEARHGNLRPLATFVVLFPVVGEGVQDVRSLVTGRARPDTLPARLLDNVFAVAGLGIAGDVVRQASYGARGIVGLLGPAVGDAWTVLSNSAQAGAAAFEGEIDKAEAALQRMLKHGVRQVPFVGPVVSEQLTEGPKADQARELGPLGRLRLGLNPAIEGFQASEKVNRQHTEMQRRVNDLATRGEGEQALRLAERWNNAHPGAAIQPRVRQQPEIEPGEIDPRRRQRVRQPYR